MPGLIGHGIPTMLRAPASPAGAPETPMPSPAAPITFVVPGQAGATAGAGLRGSSSASVDVTADARATQLPGTLKASVRVAAKRAGAERVRLSAQPGEDAVVLHIA